MNYQYRSALTAVACLAALPAHADTTLSPSLEGRADAGPSASANILSPDTAPVIVIHIGRHRLLLVPTHSGTGDSTTISSQAIENKANATSFSNLITSVVAGAAQAPSGEFHVRGSHGQYTYYLDGAPLPSSVSGSFSDLIDPKDIETLRVYTGGFPAKYGDNLAAVFDVTAKAGRIGSPGGALQQIIQEASTYETDGQVGGSDNRLSYFLSGIRSGTNRRLDPKEQTPLHDAGNDSVVFGKFDYQLGAGKKLILDTAHNDGYFQIPNDNAQEAAGVDDRQKEGGNIANLILRTDHNDHHAIVALYSHTSTLRYFPSAADLTQPDPSNPQGLATSTEKQSANYVGLRTDIEQPLARRHKLGYGIDVNTVTGHENFVYTTATPDSTGAIVDQTFTEDSAISGGDRAAYLQDNWTPGRWSVDLGARYDIHKADTETSQLSPRLNLTYAASGSEKFHAYYNRLFQPAAIEDVRKIDPTATAFKPERDHFFEIGWQHSRHNFNAGISAYYKDEQDVIDENVLDGTTIREPFNVAKGYVRGIEFTTDGQLSPTLSYYANFARSWARSAGNTTGGFASPQTIVGYFYDDHDQTNTASVGLTYEHHGTFFDLDGEYGSGFPYGETDNAAGDPIAVNFLRLEPHFIFNAAIGVPLKHGQIAFTCNNIANHGYILKQAGPFTDTEWGQGRTLGVKLTQNF